MSTTSAQGRTHMTEDIGQQVAHELVKASPPMSVATWLLMGHSLPEWVSVLTIIYLFGLIAQQGYKLSRWLRGR
jgi:disulfide bond formation protein DsbB